MIWLLAVPAIAAVFVLAIIALDCCVRPPEEW